MKAVDLCETDISSKLQSVPYVGNPRIQFPRGQTTPGLGQRGYTLSASAISVRHRSPLHCKPEFRTALNYVDQEGRAGARLRKETPATWGISN